MNLLKKKEAKVKNNLIENNFIVKQISQRKQKIKGTQKDLVRTKRKES